MFKVSIKLFILVAFCGFAVLPARPVKAANAVVGTGTAVSCTETAFANALTTVQGSGGGAITFNCGGAAGILFTSQKPITSNVDIDGGGLITLSGGNSTRLFYIFAGGSLNLINITLTNGFAAGDGGAIFNNGSLGMGGVTLKDSNTDAGHSGGGFVSYGPVTIYDSLFENNHAGGGGAIYMRFEAADLELVGSTLRDNGTLSTTSGWGGGILLWDGADAYLYASQLLGNSAQEGGGIHNNFPNSYILMQDNTLVQGNSATSTGGGVQMSGSADFANVTIRGNTATFYGGGIYSNAGAMTMTSSSVRENEAGFGGGGIANNLGAVVLNKTLLFSNTSGFDGGGLYHETGSATLIDSTLAGNRADRFGGGVFSSATLGVSGSTLDHNFAISGGGGLYLTGWATLKNATLSGNATGGPGGGLHSLGSTILTNVTFSGNTAPNLDDGGALFIGSGNIDLVNTILAHGASGANCGGLPAALPGIQSQGFNLSSDASCALAQGGDLVNTNPRLGPLAANGGLTLTHRPLPGSLAIDTGTSIGAPTTDQRGLPRPVGLGYDKGAIERQALEVYQILLPLITR